MPSVSKSFGSDRGQSGNYRLNPAPAHSGLQPPRVLTPRIQN